MLPGTGEELLVAAVGPLPGEPRVVRAARYPELLRALGLTDPVPAEFRHPLATAWRALAEGVPRVYVAADVAALRAFPEPLVVAGAAAPEAPELHAGPRIYLHDPPAPGSGRTATPDDVPPGAIAVGPWVSLVLPGLPGPVAVPPSVLVAGLYARGLAASTYPADALPGPPPPEGYVRLVPAGRRRLLHLDPAPPRPGSAFPVEDATGDALDLLWGEARAASNPVETFTRLVKSRYGAGVRVFLEDEGLRVLMPPPAQHRTALTIRFGPGPGSR